MIKSIYFFVGLGLLAGLGVLPALAAENGSALLAPPAPTAIFEFDNGFDGIGRDGRPVRSEKVGKPEVVAGKFGEALKVGPSIGSLVIPVRDIFSGERGTMEMWVSPVDWEADDPKVTTDLILMRADSDGVFSLYRYYQPGIGSLMTFELGPRIFSNEESASCHIPGNPPKETKKDPAAAWAPRYWHHVACVWSRTRQRLYIDGRRVANLEPLNPRVGKTFRIGTFTPESRGEKSTLIDRLRFYDRPLTDQQIKEHADGRYELPVALKEENFRIDYRINPVDQAFTGFVEVWGLTEQAFSASFELNKAQTFDHPDDHETVLKVGPVPFVRGKAELTCRRAELKPGSYRMMAVVTTGKGKPIKLARWVEIVDEKEWLGNTLGKEDVVLPPWTPLRYTKDAVGCWGREYSFTGETTLPSQVISAGEPLLSRPMELIVSAAGQNVSWKKEYLKRTATSDTKTTIEAMTVGSLGGQRIKVRTKATLEFDGLIWMEVEPKIPDSLKLDSVTVDIPLRDAVAYYRFRLDSTDTFFQKSNRSLSPAQGVIDSDCYIPYAWIGDNDRGLFWFSETSKSWPNYANRGNAFQIIREGKEVILRLTLLQKGQTIPRNWKVQFGLMATPVKPLPPDWRKWRCFPDAPAGYNYDIPWPWGDKQDGFKYFGMGVPVDPKTIQARFEKESKSSPDGRILTPYVNLDNYDGNSVVGRWYGGRWGTRGFVHSNEGTGCADVGSYDTAFGDAYPGARGYNDYRVWLSKQLLDHTNIGGWYHDNVACGASSNRDENGKLANYPHWPIMAHRDLYRRHYAMVKASGRKGLVVMHTPTKLIPILAYADAVLEGERYAPLVRAAGGYYPDALPLDEFRIGFMGRQWGYIPFFLPMLNDYRHQVEPTRCLVAMLMIHDVTSVWTSCNPEPFKEAWKALDKFDYFSADFLPYFAKQPPASTTMKDVYISGYKKKSNVLLIAANLSKNENHSGVIQLNPQGLGFKVTRVTSWPDGQKEIEYKNGAITLNILKQDYVMINVTGR